MGLRSPSSIFCLQLAESFFSSQMSVIVLINNTNQTCLILIYAQYNYLQLQFSFVFIKLRLQKPIINNFNQQRGQIDHQPSMNQIYLQYQQASQPIDSSSIIKNLNTSIEDLLHKINQIHQQYSSSLLNISLQPPQQHISPYLSDNKNKIRQSQQRKHVYQSDSHPTRTMRSKTSKNTANLFIQVQRSLKEVDVSIVQSNKQRFFWNESLQYKEFLMHNVQNPEKDCDFKRIVQKKITSLFNDDAVRQVKQSVLVMKEFTNSKRIGNKASDIIKSDGLQRDIKILGYKNLTLSDFVIGQKVGSGKFGQVYFCMHKQTKTVYALKKIFKSTIKQYNLEEQLCLELKILYYLNHPNVVKLYAHFTDDYHIFLLMEYVEGGELMLRLKRDESYTSIIIEQVTNVIGYLHKHNIIHRDIKPQNIVVSFQTTAKICDFGWAAVCDKKTMRKTFCGTLDYISPQMKEFGQYNRKIDLWSLGILTYQMLVGQVPFKDKSVQLKKKKNLKKQWDWDIQYSASISGIAQSFMRNLLRKNPNERANITFCKNHYFIRKYKQLQHGNIIQIPFIL